MKEALILLGKAVHQLQKERGRSALFLGSKNALLLDKMTQQCQLTDKALAILSEGYHRWVKAKKIKGSHKLSYRLSQIEQLPQQREKWCTSDYPADKMIHYYTYEIISPLIEIMVEIALFDPKNDSNKVSAYSNFLQWKERIARERGIGSYTLSKKEASDISSFANDLQSLLTEQDSYQQTFLALADSIQQAHLSDTLNKKTETECEQTINTLHQTLIDSGSTPITAEYWHGLLSHKIETLHQVEQLLVGTLRKEQNKENTGQNKTSNYIPTVESDEYKHKQFIQSLPFFSGLPEHLLDQLLQASHVRECKKGKVLFLEHEQSTRFYIILQGWIKLYKGDASGEETILQMLSSGDAVAESAVFLNAPYPLSAQVAESALLLSFPAPMIRQLIRSYNELAVNMLTNLSQRSQLLIQQVETTRLKTATERVGWFLLKTLMHQGEYKNNVQLPYDKATIASYLDMKPETFSRTLKRFKEQGFHIENNTIIFPKANSLCGYCDVEIASNCSRHHTPDCTNPQTIPKTIPSR